MTTAAPSNADARGVVLKVFVKTALMSASVCWAWGRPCLLEQWLECPPVASLSPLTAWA